MNDYCLGLILFIFSIVCELLETSKQPGKLGGNVRRPFSVCHGVKKKEKIKVYQCTESCLSAAGPLFSGQ